jgi:hypothetical protein
MWTAGWTWRVSSIHARRQRRRTRSVLAGFRGSISAETEYAFALQADQAIQLGEAPVRAGVCKQVIEEIHGVTFGVDLLLKLVEHRLPTRQSACRADSLNGVVHSTLLRERSGRGPI